MTALEGSSHIMIDLQVVLAAAQAVLGEQVDDARAPRPAVRTNGIMILTFVRPISSRT